MKFDPAVHVPVEDDKVAEVINPALQAKPSDGSTQWSASSLAAETGISKSTVHRWLKPLALQPHRHKNYRSAET